MDGPGRGPTRRLLCPDAVALPGSRVPAPGAGRRPARPGLTVTVASALTFGAAFALGATVVSGTAPPGPGTVPATSPGASAGAPARR